MSGSFFFFFFFFFPPLLFPSPLFLSFANAYLTSINKFSGLCPGGANDDVQCCVLPQEDDDNTGNKDLKNSNYQVSAAAASASSDEGSGQQMDWGYDETAETDSAPRYEEQGNEVEKTYVPGAGYGFGR